MIELRKYACILCARSSKRKRIYGLVRAGGGVYDIKTLRSNLSPEEGGGRLFKGSV